MATEQTAAQKLRAPFPASEIGKLPRVTCKDCRESSGKVCGKHSKSKCEVCGGYLTGAHIHLSYVGHAAVTDRLLQVDPEWTWEPMGFDQNGLPAITAQGGLWIWLTVAGVRRPGYGDASAGQGTKEAIGDALRNAAMRFGVGLDLWAKEDLHADDNAAPDAQGERADAEILGEIANAFRGLRSIIGPDDAGLALAAALQRQGVNQRADLSPEGALLVLGELEEQRLTTAAIPA